MRKLLLLVMLLVGLVANAQVDNYALDFTGTDGVVNLGAQSTFTDNGDWTLQFWFCPTEWTQKAPLLRCGTFSVKLGNEHSLVINDGTNHLTLTTALMGRNRWAQVTVRSNSKEGTTEVVVNNAKTFTLDSYLGLEAKTNSIWLGGGYKGRIDEVRLFKCVLPKDYASFWNNTLNKYCPQWTKLVGYWKMEQTNCANIVNYKYSAAKNTIVAGMHGTMSATGVQRSLVTDNQDLRYLKTLAYDNIYHIVNGWSRISSDLYGCLANHIAILGGYGTDDGHAYLDSETQTYIQKMRDANGNLDGQKYIVTFHAMSMSDLNGTMSDAAKRKTMAEDLINIINLSWVDGIDIDYEWFYSTAGWNYIAQMLKIVRAGAEEGKIISVTPHNVTYAYPTGEMGNVDYFEFQQYGPQTTHSYYSTFTSFAQKFVDYGYPKDKILLSYSTTSDNGGGAGVIGYNWNSDNIAEDNDEFTYNGHTYHLNSLRQVEQRTIYARDGGFGGIFYWDMCNDVSPSSTKSMARQSSMYAESNVQQHITKIGVAHIAADPANDTKAPVATEDPEDQGEPVEEAVQLMTLDDITANRKAVNIINSNGLGIIYSDASQSNVWLAESSNAYFAGTIDHDAANALWLILPYQNKYYLYNIERGEFVTVPAFDNTSQPCSFMSDASAIEMTGTDGTFTFRAYGSTEEKGYMCASPQLSAKPVCQWTKDDNGSQWKIITAPDYNATDAWNTAMKLIDPKYTGIGEVSGLKSVVQVNIYDMQGRRLNAAPAHGAFIQSGRLYVK